MKWILHHGVLLLLLVWNTEALERRRQRKKSFQQTSVQNGSFNRTQNMLYIDTISPSAGATTTVSVVRHPGKMENVGKIEPSRGEGRPGRRVMLNRRISQQPTSTKNKAVTGISQDDSKLATGMVAQPQSAPARVTPGSTGSLNILASFAGKSRVLVISAPHESDGYYRLMTTLLKSDVYCEMAERHMQVIVMFHQEGEQAGKVRRVNTRGQVTEEPLDTALIPRLMNFLKLEVGKFGMVLLKKTLQVEERYPYPVRLEAMYDVIDQTPIRKLEKGRQRGFVQRCKADGVEGQVLESQGAEHPGPNREVNPTLERTPVRKEMDRKKQGPTPGPTPTTTKPTTTKKATTTTKPTTTIKATTTTKPTTTKKATTTTKVTTTMKATTTTKPTTTIKATTPTKPTTTTKATTTTTIKPTTTMKATTTTKPTTTIKATTTTTKPTTTTKATTTTTIKPTTTIKATTTTKPTTTIKATTTTTTKATTNTKKTTTTTRKTTTKKTTKSTTITKATTTIMTTTTTTKPTKETTSQTTSTANPTTKKPSEVTQSYRDQNEEDTTGDIKDGHQVTSPTQLTKDKSTTGWEELGSDLKVDPDAEVERTSPEKVKVKQTERKKKVGKSGKKSKAEKKRLKSAKDNDGGFYHGRKPGKKGVINQGKDTDNERIAKRPSPLASFFSHFEKRRRLLVITTPDEENRMYTQQRDEYLEHVCELGLRKITLITIFGSLTNGTMKMDNYQADNDQPLRSMKEEDLTNQSLIIALRKELGLIFDDYYMVLTDFDIKVKQEYEVPIAMKAVFDYIDTFPSRIKEMEQQAKQGVVCKREDKSRSLENFLSRFRWRRRLFVISSSNDEEWAYQQQMYAMNSQACNLGLRHISVLKLFGKESEDLGGTLELYPINGTATVEREDVAPPLVNDIRNYFQVSPEYFSMLLVGKDGNVKAWYPSPMWSMSDIYDLVDSMQLRRQEMAIQQSLGMRCPEDEYGGYGHDRDPDSYHRGYGY